MMVFASGWVLASALARPGGGSLATTGRTGVPVVPVAARVHVVQPGETVWSIVRDSGVRGDPRPAVDRLAAQIGDRPLQVGQRLVLP
jgi:LysM repeat protein